MRLVGITDADPLVVDALAAGAERQGMRVVRARTVTVAWDPAARPRVGVAQHADGSFVVLDGELFPDDPDAPMRSPDEQAATILDRLRVGDVGALRPLHLEALVTWWDATSGRVTVARDHGGLVPGLLGTAGTSTVWSSDHESLLAAGVAAEPDPLAIHELVAVGWVTPPRSFLRDATTLAAGHAATIRPGSAPRVAAWFRYTARPRIERVEDQVAALRDAVVAAVARRAKGTSIAATLSAGVDSAVVVAVLRKVLGLDVATYTFRYLGYEGQRNEDEFAAETAHLLGASHGVIEVAPSDLEARFADLVAAFQSPVTFGVHSFKQEAIAADGADVVLGGSDVGYWHVPGRVGAMASQLRRLPAGARVALLRATERSGGTAYWTAVLGAHPMKSSYASSAERTALFGPVASRSATALAAVLGDATRTYRDEPAELRTTFVLQQLGVPEYVAQWNHRWGRTFGFPIRGPLWDHGVATVANRRHPWTGDKPLMRSFASTLLPHDRAYAPKIYQEIPLDHWFRNQLRGFVEDALAPDRVASAGLFDHAGVRPVIDDHLAGRNRQWPLWQLLSSVEWALQLRRPRRLLRDER